MSDRRVSRSSLSSPIFVSFHAGSVRSDAFNGGPLKQTRLPLRLKSVWLDWNGVDLVDTNSPNWVFLPCLLVLLTVGCKACAMWLLHGYLE